MSVSSEPAALKVDPLDEEIERLLARLREHEKRLGRRVRVLHIGNIANNAFHNAKLLRKLGFDCDVLCYDYYHMMGCPEWEDAGIVGDIGDDFRPVWHQVDLGGYERPRWFVQGPLVTALEYLNARWSGRAIAAEHGWRMLGAVNRTRAPSALTERLALWKQGVKATVYRFFWYVSRPHRVAEILQSRRIMRLEETPRLRKVVRPIASGTYRLLDAATSAVSWTLRLLRPQPISQAEMVEAVNKLRRQFTAAFPDRRDQLKRADVLPYLNAVGRWRPVLSHYDLIQGYATDPIWPMAAGVPYFAFEHGTLRAIPQEDTSRGRLTALAYHRAEHVFVTNSDCLENAHRLAGDRVSFMNHPYDEEDAGGIEVEGLREELCGQLECDYLLFHPTRHDWVPGTGFADKANDVALNAFIAMRKSGLRVGMVLCAWGRNVSESRDLLESANVAGHVQWETPMSGRRFLEVARACHVLLDQFKLGAFGGVTFKALAAGVPVCSSLDETAMREMFGQAPPVIRCHTVEALLERLPPLLQSPAELRAVGAASRGWVKRHHSGRQVAATQMRVYLDFLDGARAR